MEQSLIDQRKPKSLKKTSVALAPQEIERLERLVPPGLRSRLVSAVISRLLDAIEQHGEHMLTLCLYGRFEVVEAEEVEDEASSQA